MQCIKVLALWVNIRGEKKQEKKKEETFAHFMQCESLGGETKQVNWENILNNNTQEQYDKAKEVKTGQTLFP